MYRNRPYSGCRLVYHLVINTLHQDLDKVYHFVEVKFSDMCAYVREQALQWLQVIYPRYEVYRGYIVFAFSVTMFVCLSVCL